MPNPMPMSVALEEAAKFDDVEAIQRLIEQGADVNAPHGTEGDYPLAVAVRNKSAAAVDVLLKAGADVDIKSGYHKVTPLCIAAMHGHVAITRLLLEYGADVNTLTLEKRTPLMFAADRGRIGVVRLLLAAGADVNAADFYGKTSLMFAAEFGSLDTVRLLVENGADVNRVDGDGHSALWLVREKHKDIAAFLREHGCIVEPSNIDDFGKRYEDEVEQAYKRLVEKAAVRIISDTEKAVAAGLQGDILHAFVKSNIKHVAEEVVLWRDDGLDPEYNTPKCGMVYKARKQILAYFRENYKHFEIEGDERYFEVRVLLQKQLNGIVCCKTVDEKQ